MAKVARFYGWPPSEIENLDLCDLRFYWEAITIIEAQEALIAINISCATQMKKETLKSLHKSLNKMAYPSSLRQNKVITTNELDNILKNSRVKNGR